MDVICARTPFQLMKENWTLNTRPIIIYCSKLWYTNAKEHVYEICHNIIISLYQTLFGYPPPRFIDGGMRGIDPIRDLYVDDNFSYIIIYGCQNSPHALPRYVPDRLAIKEIMYQTFRTGITKDLTLALLPKK